MFTPIVNYREPMRWNSWCHSIGLAVLLAATLHAGRLSAAVAEGEPDPQAPPAASNPYQLIIERNAFRLKDPAEEGASSGPTNPPPQSNVKFTGIFKANGVTKACIAVVDPSVKPPGNPNRYYALAVGEMQDGVKILEIDASKDSPTVKVDGPTGITTLNFKDNGFQAAGAPPPSPTAPGGPAGVVAKPPGAVTAGVPPIQGQPNVIPGIPGSTANAFTPGAVPVSPSAAGIQSVDAATGLRGIPSRQVRTPAANAESGAATALIQYATMQEQAARMKAAGRPPPPIPPLPAFMNAPSAPATGGNP